MSIKSLDKIIIWRTSLNLYMKTILIISYSELHRDPRVRRQILSLNQEYKIISAGKSPPGLPKNKFICINRKYDFIKYLTKIPWLFRSKKILIKTKRYEKAYWAPRHSSVYRYLKKIEFDAIIANDINMLPIAMRLAKKNNAGIYFDAHEFSTKQRIGRPLQSLLYTWAFNRYIHLADHFTTVCKGLADQYKEEFGRLPEVILNTPKFENLKPKATKTKQIHLVHHGIASPARNIDGLIRLMSKLDDRYHLNLYLVVIKKRYLDHLKVLIKSQKNITIHQPVKTELISEEINKYDIGIFMLGDETFNMKHALPNKYFEFIQARLAVAIWPSIEMAKITKKHQLGWITRERSIDEMAYLLNCLTPEEIDLAKSNSDKCAEVYSSRISKKSLQAIARSITSKNSEAESKN